MFYVTILSYVQCTNKINNYLELKINNNNYKNNYNNIFSNSNALCGIIIIITFLRAGDLHVS